MAITWELHHPPPGDLYAQSSAAVDQERDRVGLRASRPAQTALIATDDETRGTLEEPGGMVGLLLELFRSFVRVGGGT